MQTHPDEFRLCLVMCFPLVCCQFVFVPTLVECFLCFWIICLLVGLFWFLIPVFDLFTVLDCLPGLTLACHSFVVNQCTSRDLWTVSDCLTLFLVSSIDILWQYKVVYSKQTPAFNLTRTKKQDTKHHLQYFVCPPSSLTIYLKRMCRTCHLMNWNKLPQWLWQQCGCEAHLTFMQETGSHLLHRPLPTVLAA